MKDLLTALTVFAAVLIPFAKSANTDIAWCYHLSACNESVWVSRPFGSCNGTRQSPINIVTANVEGNADLTAFTFNGFDNNMTMVEMLNTGDTVKVNLGKDLVSVSGGGLSTSYTALQFHLHWGNGSSMPGSEHTIDGKQYPMEFHIVTIKSEFDGDTGLAIQDPEGAAALGFFIEEGDGSEQPAVWKTLTKYLANIMNKGDLVNITEQISLDELLEGVDRTKYYRYLGSLTTPDCNEVVVWTLFKDPIRVSRDLIDLFPTIYFNTSANSPLMTNVFRNPVAINGRTVMTQMEASSSGTKPRGALGLLSSLALFPLLFRK